MSSALGICVAGVLGKSSSSSYFSVAKFLLFGTSEPAFDCGNFPIGDHCYCFYFQVII